MSQPPSIVALVGPTGTGKTALSLTLARRLGAEIVNCDSRQVYRRLDIGTAKPSADQRRAVPHHLFDVVDPDEPFDCARYRDLARAAVADIRQRGRAVLLVGGSGLYLKALRDGLVPAPPRDAALRATLEALEAAAPGALHARLRGLDQAAAARLHPHDLVRLVRAIEVAESSGRPLSAWQAEHAGRAPELPMRIIALTCERVALYDRLDARCRAMLEGGLIDEVRGLLQRYDANLAPLRSIGYREIAAHLRGDCTLDEALAAMQRATRQFAKRQMTWWRRGDATVEWLETHNADAETIAASLEVAD